MYSMYISIAGLSKLFFGCATSSKQKKNANKLFLHRTRLESINMNRPDQQKSYTFITKSILFSPKSVYERKNEPNENLDVISVHFRDVMYATHQNLAI